MKSSKLLHPIYCPAGQVSDGRLRERVHMEVLMEHKLIVYLMRVVYEPFVVYHLFVSDDRLILRVEDVVGCRGLEVGLVCWVGNPGLELDREEQDIYGSRNSAKPDSLGLPAR